MSEKIPFGDNSVKEDNLPREEWIQEGITIFSEPMSMKLISDEKIAQIRDKVKVKILKAIVESAPEDIFHNILSIPELAIVDKEAELPTLLDDEIDIIVDTHPTSSSYSYTRAVLNRLEQKIVKAGWVKEIEK